MSARRDRAPGHGAGPRAILAPMSGTATALLLTAALALGATGCREEACIRWTEPALACPSQDDALARMTPACDDRQVRSVDGEGEYDTLEEECCYEVTLYDPPRETACVPTSTASGGTGAGTSGGPDGGACLTCRQWIEDQSATYGDLCPKAKLLYDDLADCVCAEGCQAECFDTACSGTPGPPSCAACIDTACASQLDACANDL